MQQQMLQPVPLVIKASLSIDKSDAPTPSPLTAHIEESPPIRHRKISVLYSPRVVFRTWKKFAKMTWNRHSCLSNIRKHREFRLLRRSLYTLKTKTEVLASSLQLTRLRSKTEATFEEIKLECQGQDVELASLRTQVCLDAISGRIVARAFAETGEVAHFEVQQQQWAALIIIRA